MSSNYCRCRHVAVPDAGNARFFQHEDICQHLHTSREAGSLHVGWESAASAAASAAAAVRQTELAQLRCHTGGQQWCQQCYAAVVRVHLGQQQCSNICDELPQDLLSLGLARGELNKPLPATITTTIAQQSK